jgi:hypothetical protein
MAYKSVVSALVAQNATETTKTAIATFTVPQGVKKVIGVGTALHPKGLTTLETVSGILELESDDMAGWGGTQTFPTASQNPLTSGVSGLNPYVHPTDIPVNPGGTIRASITLDMALTITPSSRVHLIYE